MSRELALFAGKSSPCGKVALAVLPGKAPLAVLPDAALVVVVLWIVGAALAVEFALQAAFGTGIELEFFAEGKQVRFPLLWHDSDGRGAHIKPDDLRSDGVLLLLVRRAL